jgi:hypothetical protein
MAQQLEDRRDIDFVIWEQTKGEQYLKCDLYSEYDRKMGDMIISEAHTLMSTNGSQPWQRETE